jgi:hypothetical protein
MTDNCKDCLFWEAEGERYSDGVALCNGIIHGEGLGHNKAALSGDDAVLYTRGDFGCLNFVEQLEDDIPY